METMALRMWLNPRRRDEYARRHREIWPEPGAALPHLSVLRKWWDFVAFVPLFHLP